MKKLLFATVSLAVCLSSCTSNANREPQNPATTSQAQTKTAEPLQPAVNQSSAAEGGQAENKIQSADKASCLEIKIPGRKIDSKQTFAVDFEPFRASCFVTAHDPEFTDPPLGSEFSIYREGREIFKFPNQFNGTTTGCWAEGVAFQDLNGDRLTDIIIAGMCSAKSSPYSENMVYVNAGENFTTDEEANLKLNDFKKIKDISEFVKNNREQFFK